jgi:hypothetical protein
MRQHAIERSITIWVGGISMVAECFFIATTWTDGTLSALQAVARTSYALTQLALASLAMVIARYGTRTRGSAMFALAFAFIAANDSTLVWSLGGRPEWDVWKEIVAAVIGAVAAGAFVRSSQLFPRHLSAESLGGEHSPTRQSPILQRGVQFLLHPVAGWTIGALWAGASVFVHSVLPSLMVITIGCFFFFVQWRIGSKMARRRVAWLMQAVLVFAILMGAQLTVDSFGPHSRQFQLWNQIAFNAAADIFGVGCLAMAVFAAGTFNSALVVRATVAWAAAVAVLLFVINVLASALVDKLADAIGIGDRLLAATFGTIAGLALNPLASRLRNWAQTRA